MTDLDELAVERVLIDSWLPTPDAEIIDRPDWVQLSTPSIPDSTANGVYVAKLAPDEADERIAAVMGAYAARKTGFRWFVGPSSSPADLPDRLLRAGLSLLGVTLGMSRAVPEQIAEVPPDIQLRALTPADIETFARVSVVAWEREPAYADVVRRVLQRTFARDDRVVREWLVWRGGEPIGVTNMQLLHGPPRIGYFQGAAVVPAWRGARTYQAMIDHRLALLRELGFQHAVTWANERTSAPGCLRAGFVARTRGVFLEWRPAA